MNNRGLSMEGNDGGGEVTELKQCTFCGGEMFAPHFYEGMLLCTNEGCYFYSVYLPVITFDKISARIAQLTAERNKLAEAVGLMTTLKPTMVVDSAHPVEMALEVSEYITQLTAERDELREQLAAQETISEIQQMALQDKNVDISMTEANSLLRSAYQIALRNGESTNWEAFRNCVYKELLREHNLNIGNAKTYSDNNKPSDSEGSVTQNDKCIWVELDDPDIVLWATSCGNEFHIEFDKPSDNHMKYCCYCGKEIAEGE